MALTGLRLRLVAPRDAPGAPEPEGKLRHRCPHPCTGQDACSRVPGHPALPQSHPPLSQTHRWQRSIRRPGCTGRGAQQGWGRSEDIWVPRSPR